MLEALLERFRGGDRLALARLLSFAARGEYLAAIRAALPAQASQARVVAVTGPGGVGKSTLIGQLIERWRLQGHRLAVLACDPQSPLSGGALLGDRFRLPSQPDEGLFIRSLAAAPGHGAVAEHLDIMIRLCAAFGFALILVEPVGAGQADTAVGQLADIVLLLLQPESGDDLQWNKAGLLEVADLVVVHKADLPGAQQTARQLQAALELAPHPVTVLCVSSRTHLGVNELAETILTLPLRRPAHDSSTAELLQLAREALSQRFAQAVAGQDQRVTSLLANWHQGKLEADAAGQQLLTLLAGTEPPD